MVNSIPMIIGIILFVICIVFFIYSLLAFKALSYLHDDMKEIHRYLSIIANVEYKDIDEEE